MLRAAILAALIATPGLADEVWTSDMGDIVYQTEEGGAAVLSFTNVDGYPATLVIPGLAGNYYERGTHEAFWIGEGAGDCEAFLGLPDGTPSAQWGRALVAFDRPSFPTSFTLSLGWCFGPLNVSIRAETN